MVVPRRKFLAGASAMAAYAAAPNVLRGQSPMYPTRHLPFHVAVINDEISQDFERSCHVAAVEFGLHYIEVRGMWGKNIVNLDDKELAEARRILAKYKLTVTDIASPLFKVEFPGAKAVPDVHVDQFGAKYSFDRQHEVLDLSVHVAKSLGTSRIRGFDFLRIADPKPFLPEIHEHLRKASDVLAKENMIFLLENEPSCNTATGVEAARTMAAVQNANFMLNWDPGNAAAVGEVAYPNGYDPLPKNRIGHCHCKDVVKGPDGKFEWAAVGTGIVDWKGQIEALVRQKFSGTLSLETHWRGAGTPEESTRQSMAGLQKILTEVSA